MQFKRNFFIIAAILLCTLVWWLYPIGNKSKPQVTPSQLPTIAVNSPERTSVSHSSTTNENFAPENNWEWTNQVPLEKRAFMINRVKKLNTIASAVNVPIVFYGKVVDQFNQPVEGVRVAAFYNRWSIAGLIEQRAGRLTNYFSGDTDGQFVVKGIRGASMTIQLEKTGYELAPHSEMTFAFDPGAQNPHVPDPAKPVVYHMWKRQGGAELVGRWFEKTVRADGTPISLDLENEQYVGHKGWKTIIDATNLPGPTVRVWREPFLYDPQTSLPTVWRYEFVFPGGKAQFTEDEFCYLAPAIGYSDKLEVSFHKGELNFRFRDKRSLYFVNQKGQYGQGTIEIWSDYAEDKAIVTLSVSWNPDGSRNLEPKPE